MHYWYITVQENIFRDKAVKRNFTFTTTTPFPTKIEMEKAYLKYRGGTTMLSMNTLFLMEITHDQYKAYNL